MVKAEMNIVNIEANVREIKQELPSGVELIAATKTRSTEEIKKAAEGGIEIIGENYLQEAEEKYRELKGKVKFHCIGRLQKNKVKKAVGIFEMIQTVDSADIAREIDRRCRKIGRIMPVLVEVNSGKEPDKEGVMPEDAEKLIREISALSNIRVKGLMTMAPYFEDPEKCRPFFRLVKELFERIKSLKIPNIDMEILSMGMSSSYNVAVEEGANMVRIGAKIFGEKAERAKAQ